MKEVTKLVPGLICRIDGYTAQTVKRYDKTPTALVLRASKSRYLCFNINWLPKSSKKKLIKFLNKFLEEDTLESNSKRLKFFNRLRDQKFPRVCYRIYLKKGLPKGKIFKLSIDEFREFVKDDKLTLVVES